MIPSAHQPRLLSGRFFIILGIILFVLWLWYFVPLVRPTDVWDLIPLVLALTSLLIGIKLVRLGKRILDQFGVSWRRDLLLAVVIGAVGELSLWFYLSFIGIDEYHTRLERLQEPGYRIALDIYWILRRHHERTLTVVALAALSAWVVLVAMWSVGAFALLSIVRFARRRPRS